MYPQEGLLQRPRSDSMVMYANSISKAGTSDQDLSVPYNRDQVYVRDSFYTNDNLIADNLFKNDNGLPTSDTCYHNDERLPIPECIRNAPSCTLQRSSEPSNVRYQHYDYRERCPDLTFGAAPSLGQPHTESHSRSACERRSHNRLRDPPSFHGGGTWASARPFPTTCNQSCLQIDLQAFIPRLNPACASASSAVPIHHHLQRRIYLAVKQQLRHLQANTQAPTAGDQPKRLHACLHLHILLPGPPTRVLAPRLPCRETRNPESSESAPTHSPNIPRQ